MIYECQELDDSSCCNDVYIWNPSMCDCDCNKACKIGEYLDIKKCLCKKCLFGKLLLACEGEMMHAKKIIVSFILVTICFLLLAIFLFVAVTNTLRDWIKKNT